MHTLLCTHNVYKESLVILSHRKRLGHLNASTVRTAVVFIVFVRNVENAVAWGSGRSKKGKIL